MKTNGKEFKAFMASDWPEGWYMDDDEILIDGKEDDGNIPYETLNDDCKVEILCGVVCSDNDNIDPINLETYFKKWRKSLTVEYVSVEIPKGKKQELMEFVKGLK